MIKLVYTFDTGTFKEIVNVATEIESIAGLAPLLIEDNETSYAYNQTDIARLQANIITDKNYKEKNIIT